jgi:hypothetical protein
LKTRGINNQENAHISLCYTVAEKVRIAIEKAQKSFFLPHCPPILTQVEGSRVPQEPDSTSLGSRKRKCPGSPDAIQGRELKQARQTNGIRMDDVRQSASPTSNRNCGAEEHRDQQSSIALAHLGDEIFQESQQANNPTPETSSNTPNSQAAHNPGTDSLGKIVRT